MAGRREIPSAWTTWQPHLIGFRVRLVVKRKGATLAPAARTTAIAASASRRAVEPSAAKSSAKMARTTAG
eukprot:2813879-Rhodomonas_salina.1